MMPRLFIALPVPPSSLDEIKLLNPGFPEARPVPEDNLHITLEFLGDVEDNLAIRLEHALAEIKHPQFEITFSGTGVFPEKKTPHTLFYRVLPNEELTRLKQKVDSLLQNLGIPTEKRRYRPHLTLARMKNPHREKLAHFLHSTALSSSGPHPVDRFHLYRSLLKPTGAVYQKTATYPLVCE